MQDNIEFQEPNRKKNIKRIIAREGLIIFGIILLGPLFTFQSDLIKKKQLMPSYKIEFENGKTYKATFDAEKDYRKGVTCKELNELAEGIKKSKNFPLDLKVKSIKLISGKTSGPLGIE